MNTITCLLVTLLFFLVAASGKKNEEEKSKSKSDEDADINIVMLENETIYTTWEGGCTLSCQIVHTNPDLTQAPRVAWFLKSFRNKYLLLSDTEGWETDYEHQRCANNQPHRRDFSGVRSNFDCEPYGENGFKCDLALNRCQTGDFRCKVEFEDRSIVQKDVFVYDHPSIVRDQVLPICFHPTASGFSSEYISNPSPGAKKNVSPRIEVAWNSSSKKDFSPVCSPRNCRMSRQYEVRMMVYDTVPLDENAQPSQETEWEATKKKRATNHTFDYSDSIDGKYFRFQVRNTRSPPDIPAHIPSLEVTHITTSQIFYFGEQEKAKFTVPLHDETHTVASDTHLLIDCSATGKPSPNITMSVEQGGQNVSKREAVSSYTLPLFVNYPTVVYCEASNYIVNDRGVIERVVDTRTTTINITP